MIEIRRNKILTQRLMVCVVEWKETWKLEDLGSSHDSIYYLLPNCALLSHLVSPILNFFIYKNNNNNNNGEYFLGLLWRFHNNFFKKKKALLLLSYQND